MPKSHPPYAPEVRRQMVELVRSGRTPEELSRELSQRRKRSGIGCAKPNGMLAAVMMGFPEAERADVFIGGNRQSSIQTCRRRHAEDRPRDERNAWSLSWSCAPAIARQSQG